jgi:hypothetical protein
MVPSFESADGQPGLGPGFVLAEGEDRHRSRCLPTATGYAPACFPVLSAGSAPSHLPGWPIPRSVMRTQCCKCRRSGRSPGRSPRHEASIFPPARFLAPAADHVGFGSRSWALPAPCRYPAANRNPRCPLPHRSRQQLTLSAT